MSMPLVEELIPAPDPVESCARFRGMPYLLFLDSARDAGRLGRYSFLAADPAIVVHGKGHCAWSLDTRTGAETLLAANALEAVRALLEPHRAEAIPDLPPFQGGAAGYLAYDWGAVLERLPSPRYDDLAIPDIVLPIYDWVIAWDHLERRAWIISTGMPETGSEKSQYCSDRLTLVRDRLSSYSLSTETNPNKSVPRTRPAEHAPREPGEHAPSYQVSDAELPPHLDLRSSFTHRGYLDALTRVREYIIAGDIFQANLSQRFEAPLTESPWALYKRLRDINPAPFAAFLEFGELTVASASPERFLRLDLERQIEARPIKGTRPRGVYPAHDAALGRALQESVKDRAENLMIVDLMRNDLSRVSLPGSVRVPELFALERYATVHHLVSTVIGTLEPGRDAVDLLCATFPGGSITGAPKVRAMEIIAELEPSRRGVYCGSIGYISLTGVMDTSIVIRTYQAVHGRVYFSAGGGIVADSDPEQEYRETFDKARALIRALAG
ncbi:MAG TPA: aminodeoxychorismate synthase component I [Gemmatimonadaceae bacterium]|nr:aminodeoxychorismate synthase component I [Gemmatimonadaceae bacterium]